ncbi:NUDIX domain-containing protein [Amphibacillus cookii]|uniref:NUDIX domain-containing protein n=1 Tax=Amphibacillus cookii TaxID=767787 RepID=UPI0019597FCA|nr:ADP-ribose pyrophosphatase YjhB (NUDIX family) [Amphibacillus cookii]
MIKASALIIKDQSLLAVKKKLHPSHFILPGGKLKNNETAERALIRELAEELNLRISMENLTFLQTFTTPSQFEDVTLTTHLYLVEHVARLEVANEILAFEWVAIKSGNRNDLASGIKDFALPIARQLIKKELSY